MQEEGDPWITHEVALSQHVNEKLDYQCRYLGATDPRDGVMDVDTFSEPDGDRTNRSYYPEPGDLFDLFNSEIFIRL